MAFCPGKIIHTNEFFVGQKSGEKKLMSYFEAAEELDKSIHSLREQLQSHNIDLGANSDLNLNSSLSSKPESKSKSKLVEVKKEETKTNSSSSNPTQPSEKKKKEKEIKEKEIRKEREHPVEIRETCDSSGKVIESRVVDLSSQFDTTQSVLSELEKRDSKVSLEEMYNQLEERLNFPTQQNQTNSLDVMFFD